MFVKSVLFAGVAAALLSSASVKPAQANDYYLCNDRWCYDDQADETRALNRMQLEHPGAGLYAVPGYRGPGYDGDRYRDDDRYRNDGRYENGYRDQRDDSDYGRGAPDDDRYGDDEDDDDQ